MTYKDKEEGRAKKRQYYYDNKDSILPKIKVYRDSNKETISARRAIYNRAGGKEIKRKNNIKTKYGISAEQYMDFYIARKGCCDICGEHFENLAIDHCHITENIRGLLCRSCNTGIGLLKDDTCRLRAAIDYLNKEPLILRKDNPAATFYISPANRKET